MTMPRATVRLQLHAGYTLHDAHACVDYYADLGVSHLYLSPITYARPGSTHGYDVIDHGAVNPELGGESALRDLARAARRRGLGLIADIVPNHMAAHPANAWWRDVLEHGAASAHARCFDIDWNAPDPALRGKVLLPILPDSYGESLNQGVMALRHDATTGRVELEVSGQRYPVAPESLARGLDPQTLLRRCDPARASGRERLHRLLQSQHYRLAWWRCAADQINWRRFFEISELVGVRVEDEAVFDAVHALPLRLYAQGLVDGLRIDHIDGLAAPGAYLRRLNRCLAEAGASRPPACAQSQAYLVAEKILASNEAPDGRWQLHGTTGYDFMDQVGALLHDPQAEAPLRAFWQMLTGDLRTPQRQLEAARTRMLQRHFSAERLALVRCLERLARHDRRTRDWSAPAMDRVLSAWLAAFPVYRTYAEDGGRSDADRDRCDAAAQRAATLLRALPGSADAALLAQLDRWLSGRPADPATADHAAAPLAQGETEAAQSLRRFQQLTPPLAAKALEDTLFYRYGPLLSRNEVGASPQRFALSPEAFHALVEARAREFPHAMLATATHDHKRGEDARARLAVLSEMPQAWRKTAYRWIHALPDAGQLTLADRYLLVQTLIGAWPAGWDADIIEQRPASVAAWIERVAQWQLKALREAKLHTSWTDPDSAYEAAGLGALEFLRDAAPGRRLLAEIAAYALELAPAGMINSLAQTLLRNTLPGVPDLYQGTEFWDVSLVDPDNRRAVDYPPRIAMLARARASAAVRPSAADWRSGAVKQALIQRLLSARLRHSALFGQGECIPLAATGTHARHVVAWLRCHEDECAVIAAPRLCALRLSGYARGEPRAAREFWADTALCLPDAVRDLAWRDAMGDEKARRGADGALPLSDLLCELPVALWLSAAA